MKRQLIRFSLALMLVLLTALGAWLVSRPYSVDWDPKARYKIEAVQVRRDNGYYWVEAHLKKKGEKDHDLRRPVRLVLADGRELEPADSTFAGSAKTGTTEIWFKFWIQEKDLKGPMALLLNGAELEVKTHDGLPDFDDKGEAILRSADWNRSWLGF